VDYDPPSQQKQQIGVFGARNSVLGYINSLWARTLHGNSWHAGIFYDPGTIQKSVKDFFSMREFDT